VRKILIVNHYHKGWAEEIAGLLRSVKAVEEKAKKDPFHPVPRSKGEKARNRSRRGVR
jgi:hypothetical protein